MRVVRPAIVGVFLSCAACGGDDVVTLVIDAPTDAPPDAPIDAGPDATPSTEVVFSEDFDQIPAGSNLVTHTGWSGSGVVPIGPTVFNSRGVAGRTDSGDALGHAARALALTSGNIYTLRFRGFASEQLPATEGGGVLFTSGGGPGSGAGWRFTAGAWRLDPDVLTSGSATITATAPADVNVTLEMTIDAVANEVWGAYTVGGDRTETERVTLDATALANVTGIAIVADYRNSVVGADLDNVVVIRTPGP